MTANRAGLLALVACLIASCSGTENPRSSAPEDTKGGAGDNWPFSSGDPAKGQKIFSRAQCVMCHVDGGNNLEPDKPVRTKDFLKLFPSREKLVERIRKGGAAMPASGPDKVSDAELEDLIAYLLKLNDINPAGSND